MSIVYASALGPFSGDPRGYVASVDAYRRWPAAPTPTHYLTLAALFRRRQYLEGEALVAGCIADGGYGYGLFVTDTEVLFRFALQPVGGGDIQQLEARFTLSAPRLRKWMLATVSVVHQNSDTTIYLQINGEIVARAQVQYAVGSTEYAAPPSDARFTIGGPGPEAPFQLDVAGVGVTFTGAPALDIMSDWYDSVRAAGRLTQPSTIPGGITFASLWRAGDRLISVPLQPWPDHGGGGVELTSSAWSDIDQGVDAQPVCV